VLDDEFGEVLGIALGVFAGIALVDEPIEGEVVVGAEVEDFGAGAGEVVALLLGVVGALEAAFEVLSGLPGSVNLVPTTSTDASSPMTFLLAS